MESGTKVTRTIEDIHQNYTQICAKAGHNQYQIETLKKDLEILNGQLRDLNIEAAGLDAKAKEEAAKVAVTPIEATNEKV